jgi:type IV pilus assembly protein PilV
MRRPLRRALERGSVLLEALIAMLLFSIGILGLVGLQGTAVKGTAESRYRAEAAFFTNQIIGQMWADNPANLASYAHNPAGAACNFAGGASGNANVNGWLGDPATPGTVMGTLPGATAARQQIVVGPNNTITVTICWQPPGEDVPRNFVAVAQING